MVGSGGTYARATLAKPDRPLGLPAGFYPLGLFLGLFLVFGFFRQEFIVILLPDGVF
jgi:hypothetical protein